MSPIKTRRSMGRRTPDPEWLTLHRARLVQILIDSLAESDLAAVKGGIASLRAAIVSPADADTSLFNSAGDPVSLRQDVLLSELDQVLNARTIVRAHHYIARLKAGAERVQQGDINDINLLRWKEYDEVLTDSLWVLERRDTSGVHQGWYWGNFVPQIPHQLLLRYTRRGDWVLDPFVGSGTTLIEFRRLGRNGLGVELNPGVAARAREIVGQEPNPRDIISEIVEGDSAAVDFSALLNGHGIGAVQLAILHPPYHDIIRFSADPRDLSNAVSVEQFLEMLGQVIRRVSEVLEPGRYLALAIGDKYLRGEWIPLGFYAMQQVLDQGYRLKSIVVKNFEETRAKRQQQALWRYRALSGGFYVFKHEYVFLFVKNRAKGTGPRDR
jgi:hypothetical protein